MNGYIVAGLLAFAALCGLGGVWEGKRIGADECKAAQLEPQKAATTAMAVKADNQLANGQLALGSVTAAQKNQDQVKNNARTITKVVTKYVETHPDNSACILDADGLRIWNAANAGTAIN